MDDNGRLTLAVLKARREPQYVETLYGGRVGLRRLSVRFVMDWQTTLGPNGQPADPYLFNRNLLRASIVDPELDDEALDALEADIQALNDLIEKILEVNGLTEAAQKAVNRTFRGGESGSIGVSDGGTASLPVPAGAGSGSTS